jgi:prepilin-type N-terminal cleavage/methylation domain-containing protein
MNLFAPENCGGPRLSRCGQAFTLAEMIVAMAIFSLVVLAVVTCHFAGLELHEYVRPKIENAQYARQTLSRLIVEVRCANSVEVGTGTATNFAPAGASQPQTGNALRIYPSTNTTQFIYYFRDSASASMQRVPLQGNTAFTIATSVTNHAVFRMEDFSGNVLTNSQNNAVLGVQLQMRRASTWRGSSDAYQVRARVTRRNIL